MPAVIDALLQVERVLAFRSGVDATGSDRRFLVTASEYAVTVINQPLQSLLAAEAPGVSVEFSPTDRMTADIADELLRRDVIIAPLGYGFPGHHDVVFRDRFVRCALFLASDEASYVTGANLVVDGGWSAVLPGA